jgi:hypothetical protein
MVSFSFGSKCPSGTAINTIAAVGMRFAVSLMRSISVQGKDGLRLMLWTILLVLLVLWLLGFIGGVGGNLIHLLLLVALVVLVLQLITGRRAVV